MTKAGKLFIISGPSQVGKNTIAKQVTKYKQLRLAKIITVTTRHRRPDDKLATYNFVTVKKFRRMIKDARFLEWAKVHQDYYGTPQKNVTNNLLAGRNVVLVIDVQGARQIKKIIPSTITIFITAETTAELKRRIFDSRHIPNNQKLARWRSTLKELRAARSYDYMVVNRWGKLPQAVKRVKNIISRHL